MGDCGASKNVELGILRHHAVPQPGLPIQVPLRVALAALLPPPAPGLVAAWRAGMAKLG